jgi:hypothetical protein
MFDIRDFIPMYMSKMFNIKIGVIMTLIQDMSETERRSWANIIVDVAVFGYFFRAMTHNFKLVMTTPGDLMSLYIGVIIATIIMHAIIAGIFATRSKSMDTSIDERDRLIERKGNHSGFIFLAIAVHVIIFGLLFEYTYPEAYQPPVSIIAPASMFFALMCSTYIADIIKHSVMILSYRGSE